MRFPVPASLGLALTLALAGCDDSSSAATGSGSSDRIDPALVGKWAKEDARIFSDTLIFTESKFQTPYLSGVGDLFSAKDGVVKGSPGWKTFGEYERSGDTLWFEPLLMSAPDGIVRSASNRYLRLK